MKLLALFIIALLALAAYRYAAAASVPAVGQQAPDFKLLDSKSQSHQLNDYAGGWLVLYFYPKDDTPGCTEQACKFRDDLFALEKLGAKVVGISVDDSASHAKFAEKYNLPFPLLADKDGKVADSYGALRNLGVIKIAKRYTFLIDPAGKVAKAYLSVNTSRHSQEIIDDLKKLSGR